MAPQAHGVLNWREGCGLGAEIHHAGQRTPACFNVRTPRTVACLALQLTMAEWTLRVVWSRMLGAKNAGNPSVAMTAEAGISTLGAVGRTRMGRAVGRESVHGPA